jgi:hypothetical protein
MSPVRLPIEITRIAKLGGPLTKHIALGPDGSLCSDGSACVMSRGSACRATFDDLGALAACISSLESNEAIALGALRLSLPDRVRIITKDQLEAMNGRIPPDLIARTGDYIGYRPGRSALALIDIDTKGMPASVKSKIDEISGYWAALVHVLPELKSTGRVIRKSTSAGIARTDTGDTIPGSDGLHVFIEVGDGADIERFLRALHARCWLAGYGWLMVGAGGQLLERSIVDRTVGAPERFVFEASPVLDPPLLQNQDDRRPVVTEGMVLDTPEACPDLTDVEQARFRQLRAKESHRLASDAAKARATFISRQSQRLAERSGISAEHAANVVARQCLGILLPDVELLFDDTKLAGSTVGDVLAEPSRFVGATLADPLEGPEYGPCKAKVMQRPDGTIWINSFAHGRTTYELKMDARAAQTVLRKTPAAEVAGVFVRLGLTADLDEAEKEELCAVAHRISGIGKRALDAKLKNARREQAVLEAQAERERQSAERQDPRPALVAPAADAERLPVLIAIDDVLGGQHRPEPPIRDTEGRPTDVRCRAPTMLHDMLTVGPASEKADGRPIRLPAPEMPLLTPHDEYSMAHLIEKEIEFFKMDQDHNEREVALEPIFVRHYMKYRDSKLPVVTAIVTSPLVLPDGTLLATQGIDRERALIFRLQPELLALLPDKKDCTSAAVVDAMRFLTDEWLVDVAADYEGKCILVAATATVLERAVLPERPAFFLSAGQRGGGKTTTVRMLLLASTGYPAAAAGWSANEEERRKCLFSYLSEGVPAVVWDNIPRGSTISCPSIEKSLTAAIYSDRVLGQTGTRTVPSTTINFFTGNNITPRGDMASRSLQVRLAVDRADPENRVFNHADPIAWTIEHRGEILRALYVILLGNPRLSVGTPTPAETRFKMWWHLVGSAVEHAAELHAKDTAEQVAALVEDAPKCPPTAVSFRKLFLASEDDEEQTSSLATLLDVMRSRWSYGCRAKEVALFAGQATEEAIEFKAALEVASGKILPVITATTVSWRLKMLADAPVKIGDDLLVLRYQRAKQGGEFTVELIRQ